MCRSGTTTHPRGVRGEVDDGRARVLVAQVSLDHSAEQL